MVLSRAAFRTGLIIGLLVLVSVGLAAPATPGVKKGGFDSERVFSSGNDWEPNVAVDPSSSYVYMVVTGRDAKECRQCPQPSILVRVSPDRGATWGEPQFVCGVECRSNNIAGPWQADPVVRVSDDGVVYVVWLDNWNPGMALSKSYDHGRTWTRPVNAGNSGSGWGDKPWLAISPDGKDVYVAWNHGDPYVAASHDSGATFSTPVRLTPPTNHLYYYPESGVVAPNGDAYFSMSVESAFGDGPVDLVVVKSSDGGATWSILPVDRSEESPRCTLASCLVDEFQAQIVIDLDASGTIMAAYMKNTLAGGPKILYARTSTDGGATWSAPSMINDVADSNFPAITAGPSAADFRVAWQDNRNGPSAWNTYYTRTTDGGRHWSNEVRLSDLGSGAPYKTAAGYAFPYGDYFGIAVDSHGTTFVIWGEGTGRGTGGGCWFTKGS